MSLPTPTLGTTRLRLRRFDDGDADDLFAVHSSAYALRYWDASPWREPVRAERFIRACRQMAEEGTGVRLAVDRGTEEACIGWCRLSRWSPDHRSASLGYCYVASARVLEELGFRRGGTLREGCVVNGEVSDSWVYGLVGREWGPV